MRETYECQHFYSGDWAAFCIQVPKRKKNAARPKAHFDQLEVGICDFLVSLNAALDLCDLHSHWYYG